VSKRFIDSDLWSRDWFQELPPAEKCAFMYLTTACDAVGVWKPNFKLAEYQIGAPVDWTALRAAANGNIEVLPNGKWWLVDFVHFQYGELRDTCPPHKMYKRMLERHGLAGRKRVPSTLQEKEKEKELEKDKEKEKDKTPDARVRPLIAYYHDKYQQRTKEKPSVTGQWGATFKRLLRLHDDDTIRRVIDYFFAYEKRVKFGFTTFAGKFDDLLPAACGHSARASPYRKARCPYCGWVLDEGHAPDCPTLGKGC
jgi:hypothetical protein